MFSASARLRKITLRVSPTTPLEHADESPAKVLGGCAYQEQQQWSAVGSCHVDSILADPQLEVYWSKGQLIP